MSGVEEIVGIDPGKEGAGAVLSMRGEILDTWRMPTEGTPKDYDLERLGTLLLLGGSSERSWAIEGLRAMPQRNEGGKVLASTHSNFQSGRGLGILLGILWHVRERVELYTPETWQGFFFPRRGRRAPGQTKERAVKCATLRWPSTRKLFEVKANWPIADALLIAEFHRLTIKGKK